jgi:hypothetical protein
MSTCAAEKLKKCRKSKKISIEMTSSKKGAKAPFLFRRLKCFY